MISPRFAPIAFGFVLSALMSLVVSGISTVRTAGLIEGFGNLWIGAWLPSWLIAEGLSRRRRAAAATLPSASRTSSVTSRLRSGRAMARP